MGIQMNLKQWSVLSVLAGMLSSPGVTSAVDLSVNGQVRSDSACGIALGNGGVVDLGNLSRKDIGRMVSDRSRSMSLRINCQQPTKVGFTVIDNRAGTVPPGQLPYQGNFGLGNPAIGFYKMFRYSSRVEADGRSVLPIQRLKDSKTWNGPGPGYYYGIAPISIMSWGEQGPQKEPMAFKILTDALYIELHFQDDIAFTDELEIDGSTTLELLYL
ncbi:MULTISPECIES: DUF1120 domain-containing protein [unclassified Burkholderia]|uniref:DUF1120 domain-containing protein n=1 Tax=unclassified Burkholderia TaxID=2613784 RepID=UPI000F55B7E2|nr:MULTISPECIES: DUF1120 domain-containing protein [unclassified Burkholderia]RQR39560.1 DUF1120 domain-containing protein [Burkholderia sp. Bp9131]RQR65955.1 DUF1120 domain-containing protein [Burkholderia sp. Bp9015]RQR87779.1 DUF1120 domain-containing protein [Burkholderia sp. Bp9011]RQR97122.1 DUF1120 domain-containing protein [Burkholderia sp. Bp9010]RQS80747.1 DUF1120 domain-containing protein [Burkholderia sp. Bp8977]